MCSPSVHFQEPPSFLFVTHLYYLDLIWATKLPTQDAPVGFVVQGFPQQCMLQHHEGATVELFSPAIHPQRIQ